MINRIKATLDAISEEARALGGMAKPWWTARVHGRLSQLGRELGFRVCATGGRPPSDECEFVFDHCWLKYDQAGGYILGVALAAECEWGSGEKIHDDFQKLLLANADLRVIVFQAKQQTSVHKWFGDLREHVERFADPLRGMFLLCGWEPQNAVFHYDEVTAGHA